MKKVSQKEKMRKFMSLGRSLSLSQARSMFKSQNPTARVAELRQEGHDITTIKNTVGVTAYVLGGV